MTILRWPNILILPQNLNGVYYALYIEIWQMISISIFIRDYVRLLLDSTSQNVAVLQGFLPFYSI